MESQKYFICCWHFRKKTFTKCAWSEMLKLDFSLLACSCWGFVKEQMAACSCFGPSVELTTWHPSTAAEQGDKPNKPLCAHCNEKNGHL